MKYNGGFVVGVPVLTYPPAGRGASVPFWRPRTIATLVAIVGACAVGFIAITPAVVLQTPAVLDALRFQVEQYGGHAGAEGTDNWRRYLEYLFSDQPIVMILVVVGIGLAFARRRPVEIAIAVMTLTYFVIISIPVTRFDRNLLPILPSLAILAALALDEGVAETCGAQSRRRHAPRRIDRARDHRRRRNRPARIQHDRTRFAFGCCRTPEPPPSSGSSRICRKAPRSFGRSSRHRCPPQNSAPHGCSSSGVRPLADYRRLGVEYLIASSLNFDRFKDRPAGRAAYYDEVLAMPVVFDVEPSSELTGPRIVVVRLTP